MLTFAGLKQKLINAGGSSVPTALQRGNPPALATPTTEPTAVAAVTWAAMPDLAAQWRPILRPLGFQLDLHSVFCHQSPQITFTDQSNKRQRCELADLLIVVDETAAGTIRDRRAVFVQAKMFSSGGGISVTAASKDQLELYEFWPSFSFISGPYSPIPRDFAATGQPGLSSESGRYGGIDLRPAAPLWEQIVPSTSPAMQRGNGIELATFVAGMVVGDSSIGRKAVPSGTDDWSMTIDEILSITAVQSVALVGSLGAGRTHRRGVTSLTWDREAMSSAWDSGYSSARRVLQGGFGGPPPDDDITYLGRGPELGISVVRFGFVGRSETYD
jgi:hypothetical protein